MARKKKCDTRSISELRNLGPACERDLNAAGIFTAQDLIELGPEAAFCRMLSARVRQGGIAKCCNAAYLYAIYGAIHDIDWRDIPDRKKDEFKRFTAQLRAAKTFE